MFDSIRDKLTIRNVIYIFFTVFLTRPISLIPHLVVVITKERPVLLEEIEQLARDVSRSRYERRRPTARRARGTKTARLLKDATLPVVARLWNLQKKKGEKTFFRGMKGKGNIEKYTFHGFSRNFGFWRTPSNYLYT